MLVHCGESEADGARVATSDDVSGRKLKDRGAGWMRDSDDVGGDGSSAAAELG